MALDLTLVLLRCELSALSWLVDFISDSDDICCLTGQSADRGELEKTGSGF